MSSLNELESLVRASKIVERQLAKNQINQDITSVPSLVVKENLQLTEAQYEEEKQKLRSKLSTVMKMDQIEEILNDQSLINIDNIYIVNEMFDKFIKDITKECKSIDLNTFKVLFTQFVRKLAQPNDTEEILNLFNGRSFLLLIV